jgi:hypothetical protein
MDGGLDNMFVYKITFRNQVQNAWPIVIDILVFTILPLYMINRYGRSDAAIFILMAVFLFLLFLIPQLILHFDYYLKNKGDILFYDPEGRWIKIDHKEVSSIFSFDDINLVERVKSYPLAEDRMQWFPWDSYNYSVIHLKNGQKFLVTSLLVPNIDLPIESNKIKLRKTFYPFAK